MGVSGERVVTSMGVRLESVLKEAKQPYDWIMILGCQSHDPWRSVT